ncbi:unnamed protein product, partial [Prorocentrum cordatum]
RPRGALPSAAPARGPGLRRAPKPGGPVAPVVDDAAAMTEPASPASSLAGAARRAGEQRHGAAAGPKQRGCPAVRRHLLFERPEQKRWEPEVAHNVGSLPSKAESLAERRARRGGSPVPLRPEPGAPAEAK